MAAVADRIINHVRGKGRGWAFTPKDFLDLGTRASVDMALSRLAGQVQGKAIYATSGRSRVKTVAGRAISLKRSHAPTLANASPRRTH